VFVLVEYVYLFVGIGFKHQWTINYEVTEILQGGPAHQILRSGDKITRVWHAHIHITFVYAIHMYYVIG